MFVTLLEILPIDSGPLPPPASTGPSVSLPEFDYANMAIVSIEWIFVALATIFMVRAAYFGFIRLMAGANEEEIDLAHTEAQHSFKMIVAFFLAFVFVRVVQLGLGV